MATNYPKITEFFLRVKLRGVYDSPQGAIYSDYVSTSSYQMIRKVEKFIDRTYVKDFGIYFTNSMLRNPVNTLLTDNIKTLGNYSVAFRPYSGGEIAKIYNGSYQTVKAYNKYIFTGDKWDYKTPKKDEGYEIKELEKITGSTYIVPSYEIISKNPGNIINLDKKITEPDINYTGYYYTANFYLKGNGAAEKPYSDQVYFPSEYQRNQLPLSKTGYSITGYKKHDGMVYPKLNPVITNIFANTEFYPIYEANTYKYKLDSNGGTLSLSGSTEISITYDSKVTLPTEDGSVGGKITRPGYKFKGWYEGNTKYNTEFTWKRADNNLVLTAKWEAKENTITYCLVDTNKQPVYKFFDHKHNITKDYIDQEFKTGVTTNLKKLTDLSYTGFSPTLENSTYYWHKLSGSTSWSEDNYEVGSSVPTNYFGNVELGLKVQPITYNLNYTITPTLNYVTVEKLLRESYNVTDEFKIDYATTEIYNPAVTTPISWGYNLESKSIVGEETNTVSGPYSSYGNKTILSEYSPAKYTFKFNNKNNDSFTGLDFYTEISDDLLGKIPTKIRPSYIFKGWADDSDELVFIYNSETSKFSINESYAEIIKKINNKYYLIKKQDTTKDINLINLTAVNIPEGEFKVYNGTEWVVMTSFKIYNPNISEKWSLPLSAKIYTNTGEWKDLPITCLDLEE